MSYKLVDRIQKLPWLTGRHKRVLAAWASFANKDGKNIFASKETAAGRSGTSRWTVYRNTEELLESGLMREATAHKCRVQGCSHGKTHFTGKHGHYTIAYEIEVWNEAVLQNAETYHVAKRQKVSVANRRNPNVAKRGTNRGKEENALAQSSGLGNPDPSVIEHHGEVSELVSQPPACVANEAREELKDELVLGHEDGLEDWRLLQQEETVVTPRGYKLDSESWHTGMEY